MRDILIKAALILAAFFVPGGAGAQEPQDVSAAAGDHVMLSDLAARFGRGGRDLAAVDAAMGLMRADDDPTWREMVEQTAELLDASNARYDLAAPPAPTDDALYNRYAQAVDLRLNAARLSNEELKTEMVYGGTIEDGRSVALLPDEELAEWESEFRSDPRYWELRAFTVLCQVDPEEMIAFIESKPEASLLKLKRLGKARDLLVEARKLGAVRGQTLLLLYRVLDDLEDVELAPLSDYDTLNHSWINESSRLSLTDRPTFTVEQLAKSKKVHTQYEAEELKTLNAAVNTDPELAWAYYYRALYWYGLGESQRGGADLAAGNQADDLSFPLPFPLDTALAGLTADAPAGSAAVAGATLLAGLELDYGDPPLSELKDLLRDQLVAVNLSGSLSELNAWHQFFCRMGVSGSTNTFFQLIPLYQLSAIRSYVWEHGEELNDQQVQTVMHLVGWQNAVLEAGFAYDAPSIEPATVLTLAGGTRGDCVSWYATESAALQIARSNVHFYAEASQVRYPELALPDSLRQYEAITPEENLLRRSAVRLGQRVVWEAKDQARKLAN